MSKNSVDDENNSVGEGCINLFVLHVFGCLIYLPFSKVVPGKE